MNKNKKLRGLKTVEVTKILKYGLWILVDDEELFLPYSQFPWFKSASLETVLNVERPNADHLYWQDLDVDLSLDSIRHPEKYPLVAKG